LVTSRTVGITWGIAISEIYTRQLDLDVVPTSMVRPFV